MTSTLPIERPSSLGKTKLWLGLGLALTSIAAYAVQIARAHLTTPWYLPVLTTLGAALCLAAVWQHRTKLRIALLLLLAILAGAEWTFLLAFRHPAYSGPVTVGQPLPAFTSFRSDGSAITQADLVGDTHTALVFFRGRW